MALRALHSNHESRSSGLQFGGRNDLGKGSQSHFQRHQLLARLVDQWLASQGISSRPVQRALCEPGVSTLREALQSLSPQHSENLAQLLGEEYHQVILNRLSSLSQTSHSFQFATSLFELGSELEEMGQESLATSVYSLFSTRDPSSETHLVSGATVELREQARIRASLLQGQGGVPWGDFLSFQARQVGKSLKDPAMVLGLAAGTTVLARSRSWLLPKLLNSRSAFLSSIPFVSRTAATTLATVPETTALWATSKGINEYLHPGIQRWDLATNLRELGTLGLSLGVMKPVGFGFARGGVALHRVGGIPQFVKMILPKNPMVWNHAGMYAGLALSHGMEMNLGLRPQQSLSFLLAGSASFWLQLQVGGSLSRLAFPGLHAYQSRLYQKMGALEQGQWNALAGRLRNQVLQGSEINPLGRPALVQGLAEALQADPLAPAREQYTLMAAGDGSRVGPLPAPPPGFVQGETTAPIGVDEISPLVRRMFLSNLPMRDGSAGAPVERISSKEGPFSQEMMLRLTPPTRRVLLRHLGLEDHEHAKFALTPRPSRNTYAMALLGSVAPSAFGRSVGLAMQEGMREFLAIPVDHYEGIDPKIGLSNSDAQQAELLDQLVGVAHFAARAGQGEVVESIAQTLGEEGVANFPQLQKGLIYLFGEGPAVLSIGAGEMGLAMLHLRRHVIKPGGDTWRSRLYVLPRRQEVAKVINEQGFVPKEMGGMGPEMRFNFLGDPKIVAVGPEGYQGPLEEEFGHLTQTSLKASIRNQWLNVPSRALENVLTADYILNLPENARLIHVIKGLMQPGPQSPYAPGPGEQPTLLPHELLGKALGHDLMDPADALHGVIREDVEVVSGAGFTPGKGVVHLDPASSGESIRMAFSGRETQEGSRYAAAAEEVAKRMAGEGLNNPYLRVQVNHWQFSNEMGGAMKNVVSLLAGKYGVRLARDLLDQGVTDLEEPHAQSLVENRILPRLRKVLEQMLINEGIPVHKVGFNEAVMEDFERCCSVYLQNILGLVQLARGEEVPINDIDALNQWIDTHLVQRRRQFAATRNSAVGVAAGLIEMWQQERGASLNPQNIKVRLTREGLFSLIPLMSRNSHEGYPTEDRYLHDEVYDLHDFFYPESPANRPAKIPEPLVPVMRANPAVRMAVDGAVREGKPHRLVPAAELARTFIDTEGGVADARTIIDTLQSPSDRSGTLEVTGGLLEEVFAEEDGSRAGVTMVDIDGPNHPHTTMPDLGAEALAEEEPFRTPSLPSETETWIVPVDSD